MKSLNHPSFRIFHFALVLGSWVICQEIQAQVEGGQKSAPNILIAISDDQSFAHTSAAGYPGVKTPVFDRVAAEGILFRNGFAPSPGCSPSRAAFLTGRHTWQIEQAGTHMSSFPAKYVTYPDLLEAGGYTVGYTGKGWSPGNYKISGRTRNPAGPVFNSRQLTPPTKGISKNDYAGNFADFLATRKEGQPFCFWYGAIEPHLGYETGSGVKAGKRLEDANVPGFLPDHPEVRSELLDYCLEIEWFDSQLGKMLKLLEAAGELENTLVIVTSDNGMPFPRAKATCYEYGIHVPLAIRWGDKVPGGRVVDDLVGLVDLTATILEVSGVEEPTEYPISGRSIMNILNSEKQGVVDPSRDRVWSARERHTSARFDNWTYPQRALRTPEYLYIRNFEPDRWPMGDPQIIKSDGSLGQENRAYFDIDFSVIRHSMLENQDDPEVAKILKLSVAKKPAEELYDITQDPDCLNNLASDPAFLETKQKLSQQMMEYLKKTGDPRATGNGEIWDSYKRYGNIRNFPKPPESE